MFEVGRVCVKTVGRESGNECVVIKEIDDNFVKIDGLVKRRKCNRKHLDPLRIKVDIDEGAGRELVLDSLLQEELITEEDKEKYLKSEEVEEESSERDTEEESEEETQEEPEEEEEESEEETEGEKSEDSEKEAEEKLEDEGSGDTEEEKEEVLEELEEFEGEMEEIEENVEESLDEIEKSED